MTEQESPSDADGVYRDEDGVLLLTDEHQEWLRRQRDGKKTFALVGFAGTSRSMAPYDDDRVQIFALNEAHEQEWMLRWDQWLQIHQRWDWERTHYPSGKKRNHPEWLRQEHDFPIWMQEEHDDLPASRAIPIEELKQEYLYNLWRGKEQAPKGVWGSSFAYAMALALWQGAERVEVYGFEMATETEFSYQRPSTMYWIGVANGLGVEVYTPPNNRLLYGEMYGYEVEQMINRQYLEFKQQQAMQAEKKQLKKLHAITGKREEVERLFQEEDAPEKKQKLQERGKKLFEEEIQALSLANAISGRRQEIEDQMAYLDNMYFEEYDKSMDGREDQDYVPETPQAEETETIA